MGAALLLAPVPVLAAALPGAVAAVRAPGEKLTSGLQHVAAGVVLARHRGDARLPGGQRAPGAPPRAAGHLGLPIGLAVAVGVDFFIDGLILGELLVEAHARGETSTGSVGFIVGLLIHLVLAELIA